MIDCPIVIDMTTVQDAIDDAAATLGVSIIRELKQGGQKAVHLVSRNGDLLVLKTIVLGASSPEVLERARREVDVLSSISHENLVGIRSDLVELGQPTYGVCWLEEYLDGEDLSERVNETWSPTDLARLGYGVASGLGALHEKGIVHRDLSSNNIRCLSNGAVKVLDPGFAKHTLRSGITVGGQPGTRGFMTPEHFVGAAGPTPASDVFATGNLLYLAATGNVAFPWAGDDIEYVERVVRGQYVSLTLMRSDLPPDLSAIISRSMHPQPARRYRNGANLAWALGELA